MKALVGAFNQEKALVGAFSVIVQPVVEPMEHYTALLLDDGLGPDDHVGGHQMQQPEVRLPRPGVQVQARVKCDGEDLQIKPFTIHTKMSRWTYLSVPYLQSKEQNCHESRECPEEADTLVVDGVRGAVQGEEDDGAEAEDDRSLAEEGAAVRPPVLVRPRRLGEEHQEVDQEAGGGRGQVQEQHGRLQHAVNTI